MGEGAWLHGPALFVFAVARGYSVWHSVLDVAIVGACAAVATILPWLGGGRRDGPSRAA